MGELRGKSRRRLIEGRPWKQALVCALNPEASYAPWRGAADLVDGDVAVVVLDTEPRVVLCAFAVEFTGDLRWEIGHEVFNGVGALAPVSDVDGDGVPTARSIEESRYAVGTPVDRAGDSPVAISRIVISAMGRCAACPNDVLINIEEDVDRLVHTASEAQVRDGTDWPALLCHRCVAAMRDDAITSVVDFVFSRRPACPECSARRARDIGYGMPSYDWVSNMTPWETTGGCVVGPSMPAWSCGKCGNEWGER